MLGFKRVMAHSSKTGSILSLQGEVNFPTGDPAHGLGSGVTAFQTFGMFDQRLPAKLKVLDFVQTQWGAVLPTHTKDLPQNFYFRTAIGKTLVQNTGFRPHLDAHGRVPFETGTWWTGPRPSGTFFRRCRFRSASASTSWRMSASGFR